MGLSISLRFPTGPNSEIVFLGYGESKVELIKTGEDINPNIESGPFQPNPSTRFFFVLDPNGLRVQFIEQK